MFFTIPNLRSRITKVSQNSLSKFLQISSHNFTFSSLIPHSEAFVSKIEGRFKGNRGKVEAYIKVKQQWWNQNSVESRAFEPQAFIHSLVQAFKKTFEALQGQKHTNYKAAHQEVTNSILLFLEIVMIYLQISLHWWFWALNH